MTSKTVPVKVSPDASRGPGWAWMTLLGVGPERVPSAVIGAVTDWRLTLQRNQDSYFLASSSSWNAAEVWHQAHQVQASQEGLQFLLGPELVDAVLADPRTVCRVQVCSRNQSQEIVFSGVLRFDRDVLASAASGHSPGAAQQAPTPQAPLIESAVVPQQAPVLETPAACAVPMTSTSSKRGLWPIALCALLLIFIAGVAYWWWQSQAKSPIAQNGTTMGATGGAMPAACSPQALQAATDDLLFLQACVADKPDSQTVLTVIETAKKAERCDLIQRLYAHQAQAGQVEVALAYAREFDPATYSGGCFKQADVQTALYWYENILQAQPGRTDIAARIKELEAIN